MKQLIKTKETGNLIYDWREGLFNYPGRRTTRLANSISIPAMEKPSGHDPDLLKIQVK